MSATRPPMLAGPIERHSSRSKDFGSVVACSGRSGVGLGLVCGVACCVCAAATSARHKTARHANAARLEELFVSGMSYGSGCVLYKTCAERINQTARGRLLTFTRARVYNAGSAREKRWELFSGRGSCDKLSGAVPTWAT